VEGDAYNHGGSLLECSISIESYLQRRM
jgi:hypothetical protein